MPNDSGLLRRIDWTYGPVLHRVEAVAEKKKNKVVAKAKVKPDEGKSKSPADEPDEFIAGVNRWANALRPHALKIATAVGLVAVLLIGWAIYNWMGQRRAARWGDAYIEVIATSNSPVVEPPETDAGAPEPDPDSYPSAEARAKAVLETAQTIDAQGGVAAATELMRARQLMVLERFDEAAQAYAKVAAADLPDPVVLAAREGIGYAYEAKAESTEDSAQRQQALERALAAFKEMQPAEDGARRDWAMFHQARVLATLGKGAEARELYQAILTSMPDSDLKSRIEVRMVALGEAPAPK